MNTRVLIDSVVRETTVLLAQLATSGGLRAPLAHIANQVFVELAEELDRAGVSRKVSADMFGLALRGYQRRLRRLTESGTDRGRSLWEAVLAYVTAAPLRTRAQILERFRNDDPAVVPGVLHDLSESGLLFASGSGQSSIYRAATAEELGRIQETLDGEGLDELLWVIVFREGPLRREELERRVAVAAPQIDAALGRLVADGRLEERRDATSVVFSSSGFYIPPGTSAGWTAAVLDHFRAVVRTIVARLRDLNGGETDERTGGSTYTFVVWPGHPLEEAVCNELQRYRRRQSALRNQVDEHNRQHGIPERYLEVVLYAGQHILERDREADDETP